MKTTMLHLSVLATLIGVAYDGHAESVFVNGLVKPGKALDKSHGNTANNGRLGYFSDIYYDPNRNEWWGLSDRGPGGGSLAYATRMQRFKLNVDPAKGKISHFRVVETLIFKDENGNPLDGIAPVPADVLGNSFDPEGIVVSPKNGNFFVSDEYGPSLYEFDRHGLRVGVFAIPAGLVPRNSESETPNFAGDTDNSAGKRTNRGFEGLAISPGGHYVYAMLQSAMLDEGGSSGKCNRIVKFDTVTRQAVRQYAYQMEGSSQGRGISALVALNEHEFLVLERNNRGLGVGASLESPNKKVYRIDLGEGANEKPDVTDIPLSNDDCATYAAAKTATLLDLAANTLSEIGDKVPEKWEGLAIGPRLKDSSYMMLAGTDNDYSVTQNASGIQYDVYFRFSDADPFATSIQCSLDSARGCFTTASTLDDDGYDTVEYLKKNSKYKLLPGVLHAYKVPAGDLGNYIPPAAE